MFKSAIRKLLPVPYKGYKDKDARREYTRNYMRSYRKGMELRGEKRKWNSSGYLSRLRVLALEKLGGPICIYCGCDVPKALEINHKFGGGNKYLKSTNQQQYYRDIITETIDKKTLEVTCRVCNSMHYLESVLKIKGHHISWKQADVV